MSTLNQNRLINYAVALALSLVAFVLLGLVMPIGPDLVTYSWASTVFFAGETRLYDGVVLFRLLPWSTLLLWVTTVLPYPYGMAYLLVCVVGGLFALVNTMGKLPHVARIPLWMLALSIANLVTFDIAIRGNYEGILLVGLALAYYAYLKERPLLLGVGIAIFITKPIHMILLSLMFAKLILQKGRRWVILSILPTLTLVVGFMFWIGWDWILRYFVLRGPDAFYGQLSIQTPELYLQTALWVFVEEMLGVSPQWGLAVSALAHIVLAGYILRRKTLDRYDFALVMSGGMFFAFYAHAYQYVYVAPAFVLLMTIRPQYALIWLLTLTPLLRFFWGFQHVWIDSLYALAIFMGVCYETWRVRRAQENTPPQPTLERSS